MNERAKLDVLIIYSSYAFHVPTVQEHVLSFRHYSNNNVVFLDYSISGYWDINLNDFDVLVFHYSIVISMESYLPKKLAQKIRNYFGYKVLFIQDEYRWVDRTVRSIADLGINVIYTVVNPEVVDKIYHHPEVSHVRRKMILTGYVSEQMIHARVPRLAGRPIDVGYRARRVPEWLGYFGQEKWLIGERFKQDSEKYGIKCDIEHEENRRLYGQQWGSFVTGCKAMLGTESGASMVDFTGEVQEAVEAYIGANPSATFAEIQTRFLVRLDGEIEIRVISPRCFEAAALRTLMILYPGSYSGILEPWRHYVPLERSHSNMDDVVAVLRDSERAQSIVDRAYREIALNANFSYKEMIREFDDDLALHACKHERGENVSRSVRLSAMNAIDKWGIRKGRTATNILSAYLRVRMYILERRRRKTKRGTRAESLLAMTARIGSSCNCVKVICSRLLTLSKHVCYRLAHLMIDGFVPGKWRSRIRKWIRSFILRLDPK